MPTDISARIETGAQYSIYAANGGDERETPGLRLVGVGDQPVFTVPVATHPEHGRAVPRYTFRYQRGYSQPVDLVAPTAVDTEYTIGAVTNGIWSTMTQTESAIGGWATFDTNTGVFRVVNWIGSIIAKLEVSGLKVSNACDVYVDLQRRTIGQAWPVYDPVLEPEVYVPTTGPKRMLTSQFNVVDSPQPITSPNPVRISHGFNSEYRVVLVRTSGAVSVDLTAIVPALTLEIEVDNPAESPNPPA